MHFERLAIEAGGSTFSLAFADRLTVIAGVGRLERDGLITELVSSLGPGRGGVHLELRSDGGNRYAIFRPAGAPHCVVDVDNSEDVTEAFLARDGRINILDRAGLNLPIARRAMRIGASDLTTDSTSDDWLIQLAHTDPSRLWDVARKVKDREARLQEAAADAGSTPEDAELCQEIERRHQAFEYAQAAHERVRQISFLVASGCAMLAVPGLLLVGTIAAVPLAFAAMGMAAYSASFWRRLSEARKFEEVALRVAGQHSYLTFQINRVNGLLASDHQRKRMIRAADDHRAAAAEWGVLAGGVPLEWAIERRRDIDQAHARLREAINDHNPMTLTLSAHRVTAAEMGAQLAQRLEQTRTLGAGRESMPTLLDEPFGDLAIPAKAKLLEQLVAASAHQQIILLTEDTHITEWARAESLTGSVGIVEPADARPSTATRTSASGHSSDSAPPSTPRMTSSRKRSRHVAA